MMKNAFYFVWKALAVLEIFHFKTSQVQLQTTTGAHENNYFVTCITLKIRSEMANNDIELESSSSSSDFLASEDSFSSPSDEYVSERAARI